MLPQAVYNISLPCPGRLHLFVVRSMGKDLLMHGTGSSSGKKRLSAGGDGDDEEPIWELSLSSIYGAAAAMSTPSPDGEPRDVLYIPLWMRRANTPVAGKLRCVGLRNVCRARRPRAAHGETRCTDAAWRLAPAYQARPLLRGRQGKYSIANCVRLAEISCPMVTYEGRASPGSTSHFGFRLFPALIVGLKRYHSRFNHD